MIVTGTTQLRCHHPGDVEIVAEGGYVAPVGPVADENPAAHGGITVTVRCPRCGAQRQENRNRSATEATPWIGRDTREFLDLIEVTGIWEADYLFASSEPYRGFRAQWLRAARGGLLGDSRPYHPIGNRQGDETAAAMYLYRWIREDGRDLYAVERILHATRPQRS